MNLQQLKSLAAIYERRSFSAAADVVGLSHSAISLQIKNLEDELGCALFDRQTRPPTFTREGELAAQTARKVLQLTDEIHRIGDGEHLSDTLSIGVVPTVLQDITSLILHEVQIRQPNLQIRVKSGLSGELTAQVINREIDLAIVSSPSTRIPELAVHELVDEPLFVISDKGDADATDLELLRDRPFIAFSRKTWLGQQISTRLQSRGIFVNDIMEIDSLDAIERMVRDGFGVSIVPQRFLAKPLRDALHAVPFCTPQESRRLVLLHHESRALDGAMGTIMDVIESIVNSPN